MSDFINKIRENDAARKLTILKGFTDFQELTKGHMDFGDKPSGKKSNLVQKKIQDKRGHQTTRWVKNGEEETEKKTVTGGKEEEGEVKTNQAKGGVQKTASPETSTEQPKPETSNEDEITEIHSPEQLREFAEQLTPEQLQEFIDKNEGKGDQDEIDIAKQVLAEMSGGEVEEEVYQTPDGDTLESFYAMDENTKRSVLEASMKYNVNLGTAMAMISKQGGSDEETHAKIDAAQAALDDLKEHSAHPDATGEERQEDSANEPQINGEDMALVEKIENWVYGDNPEVGDLSEEEAKEFISKYPEHSLTIDLKSALDDEGYDFGGGPTNEDGKNVNTEEEEFDEDEYDKRMRDAGGYDEDEEEEEDEDFDEDEYDAKMREAGNYDDEEDTDDEAHEKAMKEMNGEDSKGEEDNTEDTKKKDLQDQFDRDNEEEKSKEGNSIIENANPKEVENLRNAYKNMNDGTLNTYASFDDNDELTQLLMNEEIERRKSKND